jgi:hypothetical protein
VRRTTTTPLHRPAGPVPDEAGGLELPVVYCRGQECKCETYHPPGSRRHRGRRALAADPGSPCAAGARRSNARPAAAARSCSST